MNDIIFALASAKGRAGVSVIRISGGNSITSVEKILRKLLKINLVVSLVILVHHLWLQPQLS